ncbi:MAG TPA: YebC/PmpR family DNA-binding transcriptional regulator [Synergistales bacterium]|nr:YebC/PmpR family DNA-binding transcriptional regulator [Synergistales bacterium]
MSGHSKWANIKHRKGAQDAKKGAIFQKLAKFIIVAAREGGGDPNANFRLKTAIEKAREYNMPMENIERAIKRGTGEIEGATYEEITYEGFGPAGVAILVETLTDNRNRTSAEMRSLFSRNGGNMGEAGSVSWMFERRGVISVTGKGLDEEKLMEASIEGGADDLVPDGEDGYTVYCDPSVLSQVKEALAAKGYAVANAEVSMVPKNSVEITKKEDAAKVLKLMEILEDHDDVQNVYGNFDIPDEVMEAIAG